MSVCIVHRNGWAVSDSRSSYGGNSGRIVPVSAKKLFKVKDHALVASVGSAFLGQMADIMCSDKGPDEIIGELSTYMMQSDGDGCLLMVDNEGYMAEICGEGSVEAIEGMDFWAIGSAADLCIGYLSAIAAEREIEPEDAMKAIRSAARFNAHIDDRVQFECIGKEENNE